VEEGHIKEKKTAKEDGQDDGRLGKEKRPGNRLKEQDKGRRK